ncbi:DUF3307 domain-containing protein [Syntrophomonas palmitatica]|uniref:DUF3307 domain-containing protein n=1 Tax=Syntrophomonas palmitatica TaxID=402877 RepID=UPI0006CFC2D9|nr:DUF3307 domain-containing protein [Syntrophomonas palmitatica]
MTFTALVLYFANLLFDYPLQNEFMARLKSKNIYILFVHSAIWGLGLSILLQYFQLFAWWKVFFLVFGHMAIDGFKARELYRPANERGTTRALDNKDFAALYIDQLLHIVQLAVVMVF